MSTGIVERRTKQNFWGCDLEVRLGCITVQEPPPRYEAVFWVCCLLPCHPEKARNILHSQNVSMPWMKVPTLVQQLFDPTAAPGTTFKLADIEELLSHLQLPTVRIESLGTPGKI